MSVRVEKLCSLKTLVIKGLAFDDRPPIAAFFNANGAFLCAITDDFLLPPLLFSLGQFQAAIPPGTAYVR